MKRLTSSHMLQGAFMAFIAAMMVCRIFYSGTLMYLFLIWNLFLAWIPFQLSVLLDSKKLHHTGLLILYWQAGYYFFQMPCTSSQI